MNPAQRVPPSRRAPENFITEFFKGTHDVWRGFELLLQRPAWWWLALLPFVINVLLLVGLGWLGFIPLRDWAHKHLFFAAPDRWAAIGGLMVVLGWLIYALFWVIIAFLVFVIFVPLATIIAAPFNDMLSEKVELDYRGARVEQRSFVGGMLRAVWVGLAVSIRQALLTLLLYALILPLHFVPLAGSLLYTVLAAAIGIRFLALQFTAYSMDRRFYDYGQRSAFLKRHRWRTIGLGSMAFAVMWVPFLNALFIPVSAVAGTLLFCDTELD